MLGGRSPVIRSLELLHTPAYQSRTWCPPTTSTAACNIRRPDVQKWLQSITCQHCASSIALYTSGVPSAAPDNSFKLKASAAAGSVFPETCFGAQAATVESPHPPINHQIDKSLCIFYPPSRHIFDQLCFHHFLWKNMHKISTLRQLDTATLHSVDTMLKFQTSEYA